MPAVTAPEKRYAQARTQAEDGRGKEITIGVIAAVSEGQGLEPVRQ